MPELRPRADVDQLRRRAKDLLRAARHGDLDAIARIRAVSARMILDSAQLVPASTDSPAGPRSRPRSSGARFSTATM